MSEHKPPDNDAEKFGDADSTPDWISELYGKDDQDMPPDAVDMQIMQLAAKKAEAPRNKRARLHTRSKWVGALASAAVVVLSVSVFLSGEVTQQALEATPGRSQNAPNLAAERKVQTPTAVRIEEVADVAVADAAGAIEEVMFEIEPESVAPMLKMMDQAPQRPNSFSGTVETARTVEQDLDITDELARKVVAAPKSMLADGSRRERSAPEPQLRLASTGRIAADQVAQTNMVLVDCAAAGEGLCTKEAGLFMLHPNCNKGFAIPINAQDIVPMESSVTYRLDSTVVHAQCEEGLWQVDETEVE